MIEFIQQLIVWGVVVTQIGAGVLLLGVLFARESTFVKVVGRKAVCVGFFLFLASVAGSLFYSSVLNFEPCLLCWWQRIFIVPQLVLFGVALWTKREDVFLYSVYLSVIGGLIALYHNFLPYFESVGLGCGTDTASVSCVKLYINAFSYLTIPLMSLTVFATAILLAISHKLYINRKDEK